MIKDKEVWQAAHDLRLQGKTYREIGNALGFSAAIARHIVHFNKAFQERKLLWTEGLSSRVANSVRYAGFNNKEELLEALKNNPQRLNDCLGMGYCGLRELKEWLNYRLETE